MISGYYGNFFFLTGITFCIVQSVLGLGLFFPFLGTACLIRIRKKNLCTQQEQRQPGKWGIGKINKLYFENCVRQALRSADENKYNCPPPGLDGWRNRVEKLNGAVCV